MATAEILNGFFVLDLSLSGDDPAELAAFKTCSGISYETEIITSEQNFANGVRSYTKRPGRINYGDIEFERGLSNGSGMLEEQLKAAEKGQPVRGDMAINLYNNAEEAQSGTVAASWTLTNAWISGWSVSDLDAESDDVLVQTLRVTHEGLVRTA